MLELNVFLEIVFDVINVCILGHLRDRLEQCKTLPGQTALLHQPVLPFGLPGLVATVHTWHEREHCLQL